MDRIVYFYYCTTLILYILISLVLFDYNYVQYDLKNQSCYIYKYRNYNRKLREFKGNWTYLRFGMLLEIKVFQKLKLSRDSDFSWHRKFTLKIRFWHFLTFCIRNTVICYEFLLDFWLNILLFRTQTACFAKIKCSIWQGSKIWS